MSEEKTNIEENLLAIARILMGYAEAWDEPAISRAVNGARKAFEVFNGVSIHVNTEATVNARCSLREEGRTI